MRFVLIYVENPYSLVRGFGSHKTAEPKIIQMKQQRPSSFRRVLKPRPYNLAHILGRSSFNFQNLRDESSLEVSPASFKITRKIGELLTSGKSFSPIGGCSMIVDYGGDHTFGDSFTVGSHKKSSLAELDGRRKLQFRLQAFCFTLSWMGEMTCGLGY